MKTLLFFLAFVILNVLSLEGASNFYFVSPYGSDSYSGLNEEKPFKSIEHAINLAYAGDTVVLLEGEYYEDIRSVRAGTQEKPIRITGMPESILKGYKSSRVIEINHSYIELSGFTIDGKINQGLSKHDFRDKLIYIKGLKNIGVKGVKVLNMNLSHALGECIRIKYLARENEIAYNEISHCGMRDFVFNRGKHNGEAIYIGTAPEQVAEGRNPTKVVDTTHANFIHHNIIKSYGSECIDIKEGSHSNIIEYNICTKQQDKNVGGISLRGDKNIVRYNIVFDNIGAGIRFGGDTPEDSFGNKVYKNYLGNNRAGGLKIMTDPRKNTICGNKIFVQKHQKKVRTKKGFKFIPRECR